jgi:hypothetical protein
MPAPTLESMAADVMMLRVMGGDVKIQVILPPEAGFFTRQLADRIKQNWPLAAQVLAAEAERFEIEMSAES